MEEEKKYMDIKLRSEEVQEVMSHIPSRVLRCGITVLAVILLTVLAGCWIFRCPDTLAAEVTLVTEEPPAFVLSHATGKLDTLYVENGSPVEADADLGVLGKALLPLQGSGKVHTGQRVHIRLDNYPDREFGYVKGRVKSVSPASTEEGMYVVEISLPDGLRTNYGRLLPVSRELKGTADIILADRNVLERLLAPLRRVVEYGK